MLDFQRLGSQPSSSKYDKIIVLVLIDSDMEMHKNTSNKINNLYKQHDTLTNLKEAFNK